MTVVTRKFIWGIFLSKHRASTAFRLNIVQIVEMNITVIIRKDTISPIKMNNANVSLSTLLLFMFRQFFLKLACRFFTFCTLLDWGSAAACIQKF